MHIAILTFDQFNEIDSFVAFHLLNRVKRPDWRVSIAAPTAAVQSMNGLMVHAQASLEVANGADAVLIGSGRRTLELVKDDTLMSRIKLDPARQLIGAQCSGALMLAKLGFLDGMPACTDSMSKPWVQEAGVEVLEQPFHAHGNLASAGGCLASQYLSAWIIARLAGTNAARDALGYVAPVGEKEDYVARALRAIERYMPVPEEQVALV
jgi:transcriptional regulator GlxA family with amidase domain